MSTRKKTKSKTTIKRKGPGTPAPYADVLGTQDPIIVMATTPDRIRKLIRGLTDEQLAKRPRPGKWSIRHIIAHLADGEVILGSRYRLIGAHDEPALPGYDQDAFVDRLGAENASATDLLDDFSMSRAVNLGLFERLPAKSFDRIGIHSERGRESIRRMIHLVAGHDLHHLSQIETIKVGLFPKARAGTRPPAKKKS